MLDGVLEEHKFGFLGEGHVVVVQVVLQNVPDLLCVFQVLVDAVSFICSDLCEMKIVQLTQTGSTDSLNAPNYQQPLYTDYDNLGTSVRKQGS